ncbi:nucleoside triphosphate pyrophosphatase [Leptospira wolffii]|uniref:nucleoside triphosphate pyrophosphatase n=1 Tax=Leptospira wolffii TaxID=409998 RepID=UPI0003166F15|nr:nucleoside triphosphate pyrophosphatase [Leptospira wolffii]EPG65258.1 septum formation protein Maf [Leptospira wolffii serovar Khorat str. Khorat-H2]
MLILRSQSPRRKAILESLGLNFRIEVMPVDESSFESEKPLDYLERVALSKLGPLNQDPESVLVSSDTIVVFQNDILQKPKDEEEAYRMISLLNDNVHTVYSGLGIRTEGRDIFDYDSSQVLFHNWSKEEIRKYVRSKKPFDKAGAYGIQDKGSPAKSFEGSYTNILGFPIRKFFRHHGIWSEFL